MSNGETMLIAYDGTERAGRALEYAAQLLRPTTVEILTAWEPVARQTARAVSRTGIHQSTVSPDLSPRHRAGRKPGPSRPRPPGGIRHHYFLRHH